MTEHDLQGLYNEVERTYWAMQEAFRACTVEAENPHRNDETCSHCGPFVDCYDDAVTAYKAAYAELRNGAEPTDYAGSPNAVYRPLI